MARLGKSKSGVSTIAIAAAVIALVAGAAYFLFAPGEPAPQNGATATLTPASEGGSSDNVVVEGAGGGSSTPVPDGTGTPGDLSTTEGGAAPTADPLQTPLPEATILANPSPTPDSGAVSNGATPSPTNRSTASTTPTPNVDSVVSNAPPTPEPTGEIPVPELTPVPAVRLTPAP